MSDRGIVIIAQNNETVDYVAQAIYAANRAKKYLNLPVSLITNFSQDLHQRYDLSMFDKIIWSNPEIYQNYRRYNDGSLSSTVANFKNLKRCNAYYLSPYDKTLLIDSDFLISNNLLLSCFDSDSDISMYSKSHDLSGHRKTNEFVYITDNSVKFYWATVVYFKKSDLSKTFFDLIAHIENEWEHYCMVYQITARMFRNDFAFSIAAHMMNGFITGGLINELPGKLHYTIDKDYILSIDEDKFTFLVEKKDCIGEYNVVSTKGLSVHTMNKFSLSRFLRNEGI